MASYLDWLVPPALEEWHSDEERVEFRKQRKRLSETHYIRSQTLTAWLLATLVAVNGGALATDHVAQAEAPSFVIGVIAAIIAGFLSMQESRDKNGLHYVQSLAPSNATDHARKLEACWEWRAPLLGRLAQFANILSLSCFTFGCIVVGTH